MFEPEILCKLMSLQAIHKTLLNNFAVKHCSLRCTLFQDVSYTATEVLKRQGGIASCNTEWPSMLLYASEAAQLLVMLTL